MDYLKTAERELWQWFTSAEARNGYADSLRLELLKQIRREGLQTTVIVVTAFGTVESAVEAMKMGAYDYVTKPLDFEALRLVVHRATERQNLIEEVRTLREERAYRIEQEDRYG